MESVRIQVSGRRIKANGRIVAAATATNPAFGAYYDVQTDESGATKRLGMTVTLAERERVLSIARDEENMWLVTDHQGESRAAYNGALDGDVVFSPFFNALPIRRLGLHERAESVTLPVVYVNLPDMSITADIVSYTSTGGHRRDQVALPGRRHHRECRRPGVHRRLSRVGRADLITPPARPPAANSSRQFSPPMRTWKISERGKLS